MTKTMTFDYENYITIDRSAWEMATVFVLVQVGVIALVVAQDASQAAATLPGTDGGVQSAGTAHGLGWAVAEVVFAGILLAIIYAMMRLPEWVQDILKNVAFMLIVGGMAVGYGGYAVLALAGVYSAIKVMEHYEVYWLMTDALALTLAVGFGFMLAATFNPWALLAAMMVLVGYDHYFANQNEYMFTLGKAMVDYGLPVIFIRPRQVQFDMETMFDEGDGVDDGDAPWGVGTADLLIPAAFTGSIMLAYGSTGLVAIVMTVALVGSCFRMRKEMLTRGSGAGLPALAAGSIAGFAVLWPILMVIQ